MTTTAHNAGNDSAERERVMSLVEELDELIVASGWTPVGPGRDGDDFAERMRQVLGFDLDPALLRFAEAIDRWGGCEIAPDVESGPLPELLAHDDDLDHYYDEPEAPVSRTASGAPDVFRFARDMSGNEYAVAPASVLSRQSKLFQISPEGGFNLFGTEPDGRSTILLEGDDLPRFGDWLEAMVMAYQRGGFVRSPENRAAADPAGITRDTTALRGYPWPPKPSHYPSADEPIPPTIELASTYNGPSAAHPTDNRIVIGGPKGDLEEFDTMTGELISTERVAGRILAVSFSSSGRFLVVDAGKTRSQEVTVFDRVQGRRAAIPGWLSQISPVGDLVVITDSAGETATVWDLATGEPISRFDDIRWGTFRFSPTGRYLLRRDDDDVLQLFDTHSTELVFESICVGYAWAPNSDDLVVTSRDRVHRWSPAGSFWLATKIQGAQVAFNGHIIAVAMADRPWIQLWHDGDLEHEHGPRRSLEPAEGGSLAWSPDGQHLAADIGGQLSVIDVYGERTAFEPVGFPGWWRGIRWAPGSELLLTGEASNQGSRLWNPSRRELIWQLRPTGAQPGRFSADGKIYASGRSVWRLDQLTAVD